MSMKKYVIFFVMQLFFARGLDLNWYVKANFMLVWIGN